MGWMRMRRESKPTAVRLDHKKKQRRTGGEGSFEGFFQEERTIDLREEEEEEKEEEEEE